MLPLTPRDRRALYTTVSSYSVRAFCQEVADRVLSLDRDRDEQRRRDIQRALSTYGVWSDEATTWAPVANETQAFNTEALARTREFLESIYASPRAQTSSLLPGPLPRPQQPTRQQVDLRRALARELWRAVYRTWDTDDQDRISERPSNRVKVGPKNGLPIEWAEPDGTEHYIDEKTLGGVEVGLDFSWVPTKELGMAAFRVIKGESGDVLGSPLIGLKDLSVHGSVLIEEFCPGFFKIDFSLPENEKGGLFKDGKKVDCSNMLSKSAMRKIARAKRRRFLRGCVPSIAKMKETKNPL